MKTSDNSGPKNTVVLTYAVIIALVAGFFFLRSFFSLIVTAMIVAFLFTPVYEWLTKKLNNKNTAAAITLLLTILAIVLPLVIITLVTVNQATKMISDISTFVTSQNLTSTPKELLDWVNNLLSDITGRTILITQQQVVDQIAKYTSTFATFVLDTITSWVGSVFSIITSIILYMYVLTAVLVHQDKLIGVFKRLNPLGNDISDLYIKRAEEMTKGMVRGQFIIAVIQGTTSAFILWFTGVPYFAFFALILSFMSLIPLGAGIITIPIGVVRILMGDIWQGLFIVLGHVLLVTNIDNILKPILVPKSVKLQPALMLLAVFAGLGLFGFLGIFIGPVIMILIITTIDVYLRASEKSQQQVESVKE